MPDLRRREAERPTSTNGLHCDSGKHQGPLDGLDDTWFARLMCV
jgi:hypothetical protein